MSTDVLLNYLLMIMVFALIPLLCEIIYCMNKLVPIEIPILCEQRRIKRRQKLIDTIRKLPAKTQAGLQEKMLQINLAEAGYYDTYSLHDALDKIDYSIRLYNCIYYE